MDVPDRVEDVREGLEEVCEMFDGVRVGPTW